MTRKRRGTAAQDLLSRDRMQVLGRTRTPASLSRIRPAPAPQLQTAHRKLPQAETKCCPVCGSMQPMEYQDTLKIARPVFAEHIYNDVACLGAGFFADD